MNLTRTIATEPHLIDPDFAAELPITLEVGGAHAIRRAADECDVLLSWGVALDDLLGTSHKKLPCLCVGIAHGEGRFTRQQLDQSRHYLDHVIAVSEAARRGAATAWVSPPRSLPNGIDTARLAWTAPRDQMRQSLGFTPDDFVVGYVGRLSPEKRVSLVLDALAGLPASYKGLIVGWGPQLPAILDRANRELPGRCVVRTATEYLGDYYRAMDAFCSPSESEGTPLTMLEAMFSGLPVLMTEVGAVPELIDDRINGLVVQPAAADLIARAGTPETLPRNGRMAWPNKAGKPPTTTVTRLKWRTGMKTSSARPGYNATDQESDRWTTHQALINPRSTPRPSWLMAPS